MDDFAEIEQENEAENPDEDLNTSQIISESFEVLTEKNPDVGDQYILINEYKDMVSKVRKTVNIFRRSPTKNDILQNYTKYDQSKEVYLIMDTQTRWCSLISMLSGFFEV
ncbi:hypothetical protein AYI69_g8288 [Smittium culicis]|uniref:Uncharacterized protein n=1 Tax=Smittium culicis TaxID=133412 RepID=A0A1R1XKN5_9FUNG|nr:hypothetical protein AYI69_g8288 [Smittium culicis]